MVVETRYAAGDGVLLGSGDHWVLVTDPGDEDVLEELWAAVSQPPPGAGSVAEAVLALLARSFDGDPPALAVVDLSSGGSASVSRGRGHVRVVGADRVLSLDGGAEVSGPAPTRRLVAGVVAASRAEVRPLSHRVAPAPAATAPAPPPASGLIDGIPAAILAATGPEGPPPARPRRRPEPAPSSEDTGSLHDTTEPDPGFMERIHEGGRTTIQPPAADPTGAEPVVDDHDGATVHRPAPAPHLRHGTAETVLAVELSPGAPELPVAALLPGVPPAGRPAGAAPGAPSHPRRAPPPDRRGGAARPGRGARAQARPPRGHR